MLLFLVIILSGCIRLKGLSNEERIDNYCEGAKDDVQLNLCYKEQAIRLRDPIGCDKIDERIASLAVKNSCYLGVAISKQDPDVCSIIQPPHVFRDFCYFKLAETNKDKALCEKITSDEEKNECLTNLIVPNDFVAKKVYTTSDGCKRFHYYPSECNRIFAVYFKDISICTLDDRECLMKVAWVANDTSICNTNYYFPQKYNIIMDFVKLECHEYAECGSKSCWGEGEQRNKAVSKKSLEILGYDIINLPEGCFEFYNKGCCMGDKCDIRQAYCTHEGDSYKEKFMGCDEDCNSVFLCEQTGEINFKLKEGCTDSDRGNNIYAAGEVNVLEKPSGRSYGGSDGCDFFRNNPYGILMEQVCEKGKRKIIEVTCPEETPYCNRAVCSAQPGQCNDTDDGNAPNVKGTVTEARLKHGPKYTDTCQNISSHAPFDDCTGELCGLREFYCLPPEPGYLGYEDVNCPNGCRDGACINDTSPTQCSEGAIPSTGCLCQGIEKNSGYCCHSYLLNKLMWTNVPCTQTCESDGGVCCAGAASDCGGTWSGKWATDCQGYTCCIGTCTGTCYGPNCNQTTTSKPPNVTLEGADGTWCLDSDGNGGYFNKGNCQDSSVGTVNDFCDGGTVRDYYCTGTWSGGAWNNVKCEHGGYVCTSGGYSCSDGACVNQTQQTQDWCVDSDWGIDAYKKGFAAGMQNGVLVNLSDTCDSSTVLLERYCNVGRTNITYQVVFCDYQCSNGACVNQTSSSSIKLNSPNGGEVWQYGNSYSIQYTYSGITRIGFEHRKGTAVVFTTGPIAVGGLSYYVNPIRESTIGTGNDYRVRIYDYDNPSVWDESDEVFSVQSNSTNST